MSTRSELMGLIDAARYNPNAIQRAVIDQLERTYAGELEIIDPMNPFVFLTEAAATIGATQMLQAAVLNRRQYPENAQSYSDLYHHMSDADYLGRFATPATVKMNLILGKDELIRRAVPIGTGNVRKLTIPRHTAFKVADTYFTMQYPIDIRVMGHGGLQVVYDGSKDSPLYALESNKVSWTVENYNLDRMDFINIEIPVHQFRIDTFNVSLNGTSRFRKSYNLVDKFYHCRVFMADRQGNWSEINTTHSDQVFDPLKPTALLQVVDNLLTVELPQVYYSTGLANTELRIDVYTTKGPMELPLQTYESNSFTAKFIDLDKDDNGIYVAPLLAMTTIGVMSTDTVTGGSNGLSFEELRERITRNTKGANDLPVTPAQISSRLTDMGYNSVLYVDHVTERIFMATRALPKPSNGDVTSGAGAMMGMLSSTVNNLLTYDSVVDNGTRFTIMPSMLYRNNNGVLIAVDDDQRQVLGGLTNDQLVTNVNNNEYLYSPLHYVLDIGENAFVSRPYYLDNPVIKNKYFIEDNDTTGIGVNSSIHAISRTSNGWRILVQTDTDDSYKELDDDKVYMQLCFKPVGENDLAYLNGTLIGKNPDTNERIFEFLINTNWDIDGNDNLGVTSFTMYEDVPRVVNTPLQTNFDIIYVAADHNPVGLTSSWIDTQLGRHLLPDNVTGIYYERLTISLGESMSGLWNRARTVIGTEDYERYEEDVLATYAEDVYLLDNTGTREIVMNDGVPEFVLLHSKGDTVMDGNGNPVVLHYQGDIKVDENNRPIVISERDIVRQMDLFLVDGVYYFATGDIEQTYAKSIPETLVGWLKTHIRPMSAKLLEKTKLYLHPRATVGFVDVVIGDNLKRKVLAAQELEVTFHVSNTVYKDLALRGSIEARSTEVIAELLTKSLVVRDEILSKIKAVVGTDIISVEVTGLGGAGNYTTITMVDDSGRLCIGKQLVNSPDGSLIVQDSIQFTFVRHTVF